MGVFVVVVVSIVSKYTSLLPQAWDWWPLRSYSSVPLFHWCVFNQFQKIKKILSSANLESIVSNLTSILLSWCWMMAAALYTACVFISRSHRSWLAVSLVWLITLDVASSRQCGTPCFNKQYIFVVWTELPEHFHLVPTSSIRQVLFPEWWYL